MIYPVFLAVSAILYLAALARALPASHNMTSMSLQRAKNIQKDFLETHIFKSRQARFTIHTER
jgi:hypothetical protein